MDITAISDLHGHYPELPGGDLLIVAGDLTGNDRPNQLFDFSYWLKDQNYKKKITIAGNHDNLLRGNESFLLNNGSDMEYLCDSGTEFEYEEPVRDLFNSDNKSLVSRKKLKIWGSPWTRRFEGMNPDCMAFTVDTDEELREKWAMIPDDVDVLVTHSPPWGIADENRHGEKCGSKSLYEKLIIVKPRAHIFGHIHECGYKHFEIKYPLKIDQLSSDMILVNYNKTHCINASHVNECYQPVNKPVRIEL